jgi:transposase
VVEVPGEARAALEALTRRTTAAGLARRARIVLRMVEGEPLDRIARELGVQWNVVRTWVDRSREAGLTRLQDRPQSGRPQTFPF